MRSPCGLALCLGFRAGAQSMPVAAQSLALPGQDLRSRQGDICSASPTCIPLGSAPFQHSVPKGFAVPTDCAWGGYGGLSRVCS